MGANARIPALSQIQEAELTTLVGSLRMVLDDATYINGEAKQMLLSQLLSDRDVPDNTTIVHKAVTERGLMKTLATTQKRGLSRFATDAEVQAKTPLVALAAYDFPLAMQTETADNFYSSGNSASIFDRAYPAASAFTPNLSVTVAGRLIVLGGAFTISFGGSVSKFEIYLKCRVPAHVTGAQVTHSDGSTLRACGAAVQGSNGFTLLTVHLPSAITSGNFYFGATYQSVL